jgi:hypothetical protein
VLLPSLAPSVQDGSKERNPALSLLQISRIRTFRFFCCVLFRQAINAALVRRNGYILSRLPAHSLQYAINCHQFRRAEPNSPRKNSSPSSRIPSSALHCILVAMARLLLIISADFSLYLRPAIRWVGTAENTPHVERGAPLPRKTAVFFAGVGG